MSEIMSNETLINKFLGTTRTESSEKNYRSDITSFANSINKSLIDVDIDDITYYFNKVLFTYKPRSKNRKISSLRKFYQYLIKKKLYKEENPLDDIEYFKIDENEEKKTLSVEEKDELIDYLKDQIKKTKNDKKQNCLYKRDLAMISLMLNTGLRVGETIGLDFKKLRMDEAKIVLVGRETKSKKSRTLYINKNTIKYLNDYLAVRDILNVSNEIYVFLSHRGKKLTTDGIDKMLKKYAKECKIENLHAHLTRHLFGTTFYKKYKDINLLKEALGHANVSTSLIYVDENEELEKMTKLNL